MSPAEYDSLFERAEAEFKRLYPNRSPNTYTALRQIAQIARRLLAVS